MIPATRNTNVKIRFRGRDYFIYQGRHDNGSVKMWLVHPPTKFAFPAGVDIGLLPQRDSHVFVPEFKGLVDALEAHGIVRATPVVGRQDGMNIRTCELVHPDLLRMHREACEKAHGCEERVRESAGVER